MTRIALSAFALLLALASPAAAQPAQPASAGPAGASAPADEFLWLEEVQGARALDWVRAQNARTKAVLEADPRYARFRDQALAILTASDRIAAPRFRAGGVDNFWQDRINVRGVWRRTTVDSYRTDAPQWETVLDIDALARAENANWIYKGSTCLPPARRYCLVSLSDGGKDAVVVREFDTQAKAFRAGGFSLPQGKHRLDWVDDDTIAIATDFGPGTLTESGYPFVLKLLDRGQTLAQAREIYRGSASDGGYGVNPTTLRDEAGRAVDVLVARPVSTFDAEHYLVLGGAPRRIDLPTKAQFGAFVDGQAVFALQQAWGGFAQGAIVGYDIAALKRSPQTRPRLVLQPAANQSIGQIDGTEGKLVVAMLEDVKGAVEVFDFARGQWTRARLPLPQNATLTLVSTSSSDDRVFVSAQGFLEPTTLWLADAATGAVQRVKAQAPRFDASGAVVEQKWATSSDGTRIPFFIVRPRTAPAGGAATVMFGYGGFELSKPPVYIPEMGKLWLENGGVFVNANIRGGGEFGPAWHQSVLRENRQKAFDDFAAVARELVRLGITTPQKLGIYGRSNGGVLTSVTLTQHPELIGAAVIESPLVDMLRYHELPPGASWIGEYGDPRVAADAAFIARYSAYQNLAPGRGYPMPYITTNTRDDRVHPGHARKFAARMQAMGYQALYYENTEGGHSNDSDPVLNAERWARHYVYLSRALMD
jgi:prolyl oligopeptidase